MQYINSQCIKFITIALAEIEKCYIYITLLYARLSKVLEHLAVTARTGYVFADDKQRQARASWKCLIYVIAGDPQAGEAFHKALWLRLTQETWNCF